VEAAGEKESGLAENERSAENRQESQFGAGNYIANSYKAWRSMHSPQDATNHNTAAGNSDPPWWKKLPGDIRKIEESPGPDWIPHDNDIVGQWWCEDRQIKLVLTYAARWLGSHATMDNAEDETVTFLNDYAPREAFYISKADYPEMGSPEEKTVIPSERCRHRYLQPGDPMGFCQFLFYKPYKQWCLNRGRDLSTQRRKIISLSDPAAENTITLSGADFDERADPQRNLYRLDIQYALNSFCTETERQAIALVHFKDYTWEEAGKELGLSLHTARNHAHRGYKKIKSYLESTREGWADGP
jgi:hypothetical protein